MAKAKKTSPPSVSLSSIPITANVSQSESVLPTGLTLDGNRIINMMKIGKPDFDVLIFASKEQAQSFIKLNPSFLGIN